MSELPRLGIMEIDYVKRFSYMYLDNLKLQLFGGFILNYRIS